MIKNKTVYNGIDHSRRHHCEKIKEKYKKNKTKKIQKSKKAKNIKTPKNKKNDLTKEKKISGY